MRVHESSQDLHVSTRTQTQPAALQRTQECLPIPASQSQQSLPTGPVPTAVPVVAVLPASFPVQHLGCPYICACNLFSGLIWSFVRPLSLPVSAIDHQSVANLATILLQSPSGGLQSVLQLPSHQHIYLFSVAVALYLAVQSSFAVFGPVSAARSICNQSSNHLVCPLQQLGFARFAQSSISGPCVLTPFAAPNSIFCQFSRFASLFYGKPFNF